MVDEPTTPETFEDELAAISQWVGDVTPPDPWLLSSSTPTEQPPAERPAWQRALAVAASIALVLVGVLALTRGQGAKRASRPPTSTTLLAPTTTAQGGTPTSIAPVAEGWNAAAQSPLSPRNLAQGVWTGSEVLVFGGTSQPQCPVCDYASFGDTLHDAAAYNPTTDTWRVISSMPADASYVGQSVMAGGDVFFYSMFLGTAVATPATYRLWRYSVAGDAWTEMKLPPTLPDGGVLTARANSLVLVSSSDEVSEQPDWTYSLQDSKWTQLPDDPFDGSFDRQMLDVDGRLILFNHSLHVLADPSQPGLVRAAQFDDHTQTWTTLPQSDQLTAPWVADGAVAIAPAGGSADGGEADNWGRSVPFGGWLATTDDSWHPLPPPVPDDAIGVVGRQTSFFGSDTGSVLDMGSGTWIRIPPLPSGLHQQNGQTVVAAGSDLFTFGGSPQAAQGQQRTVHNSSFIWHAGDAAAAPVDGQAAVDAAVAALGIDPDTVPHGILTLGDARFCGYENNFLTGVEDLREDARQCFRDHFEAGTGAMFITQRRTLEGAPLATVYVTRASVASAYRDATRDPLGATVWSGGACATFTADDGSGHTEFRCTYPADLPPLTTGPGTAGETLTLLPAGGCGAASFAAISADQTVSINIYLTFGNEVGVTERTFTLPDPVAIVELRRGSDLGEGICNDVISHMRVATKSDAVAGTLHLVTTATPEAAVSGACGAMSGTLDVSGLQFDDGTKVADLSISTTGLNCFAG